MGGAEPGSVPTTAIDRQVGYDASGKYVYLGPSAAPGTEPKVTVDLICDEVQYPDDWAVPDAPATLRERVQLLADEAVNAVAGPRNKDYGDPRFDMAATAEMMNGYLHKRGLLPEDQFLQPFDVPMLLELVKMSRLAGQPGHHDSMVDVVGWMGVYQECAP